MKCAKCQQDIPDDSLYCNICGAKQATAQNPETKRRQTKSLREYLAEIDEIENQDESGEKHQICAQFHKRKKKRIAKKLIYLLSVVAMVLIIGLTKTIQEVQKRQYVNNGLYGVIQTSIPSEIIEQIPDAKVSSIICVSTDVTESNYLLKQYEKKYNVNISSEEFHNYAPERQYYIIDLLNFNSYYFSNYETKMHNKFVSAVGYCDFYVDSGGNTYHNGYKSMLKDGETFYTPQPTAKVTSSSSYSKEYRDVDTDDDAFACAIASTKIIIKDKLVAPSTAKFPWDYNEYYVKRSGNDFIVGGYVDSENSFGAMLRQEFVATFTLSNVSLSGTSDITNVYVIFN